jgi:hypothetical protein
LACVWPGQQAQAVSAETEWLSNFPEVCQLDISNRDYDISSNAWNTAALTSLQKHVLFLHFSTTFLFSLSMPETQVKCSDDLFSLAHRYPMLMDTFLSCSAIFLSNEHSNLLPFALHHYSTAISSIRAKINDGSIDGTEDWLMVMTLFLCIFEVSVCVLCCATIIIYLDN